MLRLALVELHAASALDLGLGPNAVTRRLTAVDYELAVEVESGIVYVRHRATGKARLIPLSGNVRAMEPAEGVEVEPRPRVKAAKPRS